MSYQLGGQSFRTKSLIREHYQAVREQTPEGGVVTDPVVLELFQKHPDWLEKSLDMECITKTWIIHTGAAPSLQFAIRREDGSIMDISYRHVLNRLQKDGTLKPWDDTINEFCRAARQEVNDQIQKHRQPGMHVDHVYPHTFQSLLFDFCRHNWISPWLVAVDSTVGAVVIRKFEDRELAQRWRDYHEANARFEVVTPEENLSRQKITPDWDSIRYFGLIKD